VQKAAKVIIAEAVIENTDVVDETVAPHVVSSIFHITRVGLDHTSKRKIARAERDAERQRSAALYMQSITLSEAYVILEN
jgi:hypothetical protein